MDSEVLLIRGLFRGRYHWGNFPEELQQTLRGKKVVSFDIPGNGFLNFDRSPKSIEGMVESIRSQRLSKGKVSVVAISMGGMIGLKWAEMYPEEIETLICINTTSKGASPFYQRLLPRNYFRLAVSLFSNPFKRELYIHQMVSNRSVNVNTVNKWACFSKLYPTKKCNFFRQLIAAQKYRASKPRCQVFFISSKKDNLVSYKATRELATLWGLPLIINHHDGHDIPLDNPVWLCEVLRSLISVEV